MARGVMHGRGMCVAGGHAWQWVGVGGHVWQGGVCGKGMHGREGMHGRRGCVWQGGMHRRGVCMAGEGCAWQGVGACMAYGQ